MPDVRVCDPVAVPAAAAAMLDWACGRRLWAFTGPLGAGKTTLIQSLCKALGVAEPVSSPTFALVNAYEAAGGEVVYHLDLYRLDSLDEALAMGIEEYLDSGHYCLIEWPAIIEPLLPEEAVQVIIEPMADSCRLISYM
jgi:tRNA threonylcarbamoyladenosine biosynthesis protein TsaE